MGLELLRTILPSVAADALPSLARPPFDRATLAAATAIVDDVRARREQALVEHARRLDALDGAGSLWLPRARLLDALEHIPHDDRGVLERAADRIETFARAQRAALQDLTIERAVDGGSFRVGHRVIPMQVAGCYAPGGRYPLPSSVLMTALTARAAGVATIVVASPNPQPITLAAAALAGAEGVLAAGGAQAVAAMAFGVGVPRCDIVAGPGNRWVTAAKHVVSSEVAIDMLAGPSEIVIIADESADAVLIAADLIAQAEHDEDARAILITTAPQLVARVRAELGRQLADLPTRATAIVALERSAAVCVEALREACALSNTIAPEHLEVQVAPEVEAAVLDAVKEYGALFVGAGVAEVLGDYGIGPNHTLPTGGTARFSSGLSVFDFVRTRTFVLSDRAATSLSLYGDTAHFARLEGLEGHARAAELRARSRSR